MTKKLEIKKQCDFIQDMDGKTYVSRPTSWMAGWARHLWFEHHTGIKPVITSPEAYKILQSESATFVLTEYSNGDTVITQTKGKKDGVA